MGRAFRNSPQTEIASRNELSERDELSQRGQAEIASRIRRSEWDLLSGRGLKWKMRPRARNGAAAQLCVRTDGYVYCNVAIRGKDGCHGNG